MGKDVLRGLIERRERAVTSAEAIMTRSLEEERDDDKLTDAETTELEGLRSRITELDKSISEWEAVVAATDKAELVRSRLGSSSGGSSVAVVTREEAVYRIDGERSFFGDLFAARNGSTEARENLDRYTRAMTTSPAAGGGGNIVPPQYIASLFAPDAKFGSPMAASWPQYALSDARAFQIPRQLTATTVAAQSGENVHPTPADITFDQITVTPSTQTGSTVVSRQLLDGSLPAVDQIIANDLRGELLYKHEVLANTTLFATSGATTATSTGQGDEVIDAIVAAVPTLYGARKMPADTIYVGVAMYGILASAKDTTGRPLLNAYGPQNAPGVGDLAGLSTNLGGLPIVVSPAIAANKVVVARRSDFAFFSSPSLSFRYEEKAGPESIEIGVWQYIAAVTARYPKSVTLITHTPA